jgi:ubiquinone/menaquinone biosynthesis C-methylase UbiE
MDQSAMNQPTGYVSSEYLRMAGESVRHIKQRTYELMQVQPGQVVLDVGCGPASDTLELGKLVGPQGQVYGVDHDPAMVAEAERRAQEAGIAAWVLHKHAESDALPFDSNFFDSCRSERLLQHLPDPVPTVAEMVRVTKSGGAVLLLDTDWGSGSFDSTETDIERRLARVHAELAANNGYAGRQLYRLLKQAGLLDVKIEVYSNWSTNYAFTRQVTVQPDVERVALEAGIVTQDELQRLHAQYEKADADGLFFGCANQMLVVGHKP